MKATRTLPLLAASLLLAGSLTGCSLKKHTFTVYAEGDYISEALLESFTEETGIKVNYVTGDRTPAHLEETYFGDSSDPESALSEALGQSDSDSDPADAASEEEEADTSPLSVLQASRAQSETSSASGDGSGSAEPDYDPAEYDVIFTSGSVISELAEAELLLPLSYESIDQVSNIDSEFIGLSYDPNNLYSVTTLWGTLGLLVNTSLVSEQVNTWGVLLDSAYQGQIVMPSTAEECIPVALLAGGLGASVTDETSLNAVYDLLETQRPLVADYAGRDAFLLMQNNQAALYPCYSGDAVAMMSENPSLTFVIPQEGTVRQTFGYCVAADTIYSDEAHQFINYMCSAENLAKNAVYAKYAATSTAAREQMDESWSGNLLLYPDSSVTENISTLSGLSGDLKTLSDEKWAALTAQSADPADQSAGDSSGASSQS